MSTTEDITDDPGVDDRHRLPRTVLPQRYDLELSPDLDAATFDGTVAIEVEVVESTDTVTLHALELDITSAWIETAGRNLDATIEFDPTAERVTLTVAELVPAGNAEIHMAFRGTLNDQLVGFYRSTFELDGVERTIATTQFEATHARQAFPCFDEPEFKASFGITLVVPADLLAVSNAAEVHRTPTDDGRIEICFADTMVMSTYLVAFVIGPLEATDERIIDGGKGSIPLRVIAPPGNLHLTAFALEVADAAVRFFEDYYDLPYPGDKIDLVAVPDFAFGAMENLGCITFREVLLLIDPEQSTQPELQRAADVINHELAHMWFGDLVTMKWWNGIWLNEAFATFMEVTATDSFRPEWDVWTGFGLARAEAFDTDSLRNTRPIEYECRTAADSEAMFDVLTYEKGASVLRMLERYLGADRFRDGIRNYLRRHAYANTETTDLWDALEQVADVPVRRIMDAWIFRGGHPQVSVTVSGANLHLEQRRFAFDTSAPGTEEGWPVPVVLTTELEGSPGATDEHRLLLERPVDIDLGGPPSWVQPNHEGNGFYRSVLSPDLRTALASVTTATPLERFVLLDDTWATFLAGDAGLDEVVELVRTVAVTEADPSVWRRLSGALRSLHHLVPKGQGFQEGQREHIESVVRDVASAPLRRFDADVASGSTERSLDLRSVLFSLLGTVGVDAEVRQRAQAIVAGAPADAPLAAAAVAVAAVSARGDAHRDLERRWRESTNPQEEIRFLYALADTPDQDRFTHVLELARTEVRTQNAPYLLRRCLDHSDLGPVAWDYIAEHWDELLRRFPTNAHPRMVEGIRTFTDPALARSVDAFLNAHPLVQGLRQMRQHIERMWVTVAAAERLS